MPSGLCPSNNDALARRDRGLEFLDVTSNVAATLIRIDIDAANQIQTHHLTLTNISSQPVNTHLILCLMTMTPGVQAMDAEGQTTVTPLRGVPYLRFFIPDGQIPPDGSMDILVRFRAGATTKVAYTLDFLSGQRKP